MEQTEKPIIYKSSTIETPSTQAKKPWLREHMAKVVYGTISVIILFQLIWGIRTIIDSRYTANAAPQIQNASFGSVTLDSQMKQANVGAIVPVNIRISTGGHGTDSTDLIIKFNPNVLEASASSFFLTGNTYRDYILSQVDNKIGEIHLIGATPPNTEGFVGVGSFGTINFIAKALGDSPITVAINKGSTADSNMVDTLSGNNILEQANNTNIQVVKEPVSFSSEAPKDPNSCSGYLQYCYNLVGQIGSQYCSQGKEVNNSCRFDPNLTISCTQCNVGL